MSITMPRSLPARALTLCALALTAAMAAGPAAAQGDKPYPQRPIRLIVPFPAGGPTDLLARVVTQRMGERLHQTFVVDNRPGANTIIGADAVAKAAPDGYTILLAIDNTLVMNQFLYSKLPYDPIRDFEPIGKAAIAPLVVVSNASSGPKTMAALLAQIKAAPEKVSYGFGTFTTQLSGELLRRTLGAHMVDVSYKGSAGVTQGLLSNDVTFAIDGVTSPLPHIKKGTFNALARLSSKPISSLPNLPTLRESGVDMPDIEVWMGFVAPKGTPAPIIEQLNREMRAALAAPDVQEKLSTSGLVADGSTPEELRAFIDQEAARWKTVIHDAGIRID